MKNSIKKYKYLRVIGIIIFAFVLYKVDIKELFSVIKNVNIFYFAATFLLLSASPICGALKWKILVDSQNVKVPFTILLKNLLKGLFLGTVTPGRLGELWRAKYLADAGSLSLGKAFYTVILDRIIDVIIITVIGIIGILLFLSSRTEFRVVLIISIIILSLLIVAFFIIKKQKQKKLFNILINFFVPFFIPDNLKTKINVFLTTFFDCLKQLKARLFLKITIYGLIYYSLTVVIYYFLVLSLGINISFFNFFFINALVLLILLIPITLLGLGTRDAGYIFFLAAFGIAYSSSLALSILIFLTGIVLSIPGLILFLKSKST